MNLGHLDCIDDVNLAIICQNLVLLKSQSFGTEASSFHQPGLQSLILNNCPFLTNSGLVGAVELFPNLVCLELNCSPLISDVGIALIATSCTRLKRVCLSLNAMITNDAIKMLATKCPYLEDVDFSYCFKLGHDGIEALALHAKNLKKACLNNVSNLETRSVKLLLECCPSLFFVNVSGCQNIHSDLIHCFFQKSFPELRYFLAMNCSNIGSNFPFDITKGANPFLKLYF